MRERLGFIQGPISHIPIRICHSYVAYHGYPAIGVSFEAEGKYGGQNEEHGSHGNYLKATEKSSTKPIRVMDVIICEFQIAFIKGRLRSLNHHIASPK